MDNIQNAVADSGSKIINLHTGIFLQLLYRLHMALGQIHHVDIIADARAVGSIIIIAEHIDLRQLSNCHLSDIR